MSDKTVKMYNYFLEEYGGNENVELDTYIEWLVDKIETLEFQNEHIIPLLNKVNELTEKIKFLKDNVV